MEMIKNDLVLLC